MRKTTLVLAGLIGITVAAPASASTVVTTACVSVSDAAGCLFDGNINGNPNATNVNSYLNAQNAYNAIRNPDITLNFITTSDAGNFGTFGSITGDATASGMWSLPGFMVDYIAVKASNQFVLYKVSGSSGSWNTLNIPYRNNPHGLSHLAFFGSAIGGGVPEPSAWALMILGLGVAGAGMRRRKVAVSFA